MVKRSLLLAGVAALALGACGKKEGAGAPETKSSAAAAQTGAASPLDAPFALKGAEAVDADAIFALLPEDGRPTYESARFDEKLGATVVSGLVFSDAEDVSEEKLLIERAEFYGVDLDAVERARTGTRAVDAPFESVFQKVRLFGLSTQSSDENDADASIGAVEIDSFRVRQGGFSDADAGEKSAAHLFNAFDLGGLYFKDINVAGEDSEEGGKLAFKAPDLRFVGLGGGKLGALIVKDAEYEIVQTPEARQAMAESFGPQGAMLLNGPLAAFIAPANQRVTMKSFDWRGVDLSGWMGYALKDEKPPLTARNLINLGTMKILDTTAYIDGRKAATTAEATVSAAEFTWLMPSKIRTETKGAMYDFSAYLPPEEEKALEIVKRHGLDNVKASGTFAWDWDANKGGAALKTDFDTQGLADFDFDMAFAGLELEKINKAMEAGQSDAVVEQGAFKSLTMTIADEKLLDAVFDIAGLQMNQSGADLRASAPAMIRLSGAQAAALSPRIADYVSALADFVAEGGSLNIAAKPAEPVTFKALSEIGQTGPQAAPDALNLTVTHKK